MRDHLQSMDNVKDQGGRQQFISHGLAEARSQEFAL